MTACGPYGADDLAMSEVVLSEHHARPPQQAPRGPRLWCGGVESALLREDVSVEPRRTSPAPRAGGRHPRGRRAHARAWLDPAAGGRRVQLVDVRTEIEWRTSRIRGAVHAPLPRLERELPALGLDPAESVVCICLSGPSKHPRRARAPRGRLRRRSAARRRHARLVGGAAPHGQRGATMMRVPRGLLLGLLLLGAACGDAADGSGAGGSPSSSASGGSGGTSEPTSTGAGGVGGAIGPTCEVRRPRVPTPSATCSPPGTARADGTLVAIVRTHGHAVHRLQQRHVVLQVAIGGAVQRLVVNVEGVAVASTSAALVGPAFAEGWHLGAVLEYVDDLDLHSDAFAQVTVEGAEAFLCQHLVPGDPISVFAYAEDNPSSAHQIHSTRATPTARSSRTRRARRPRTWRFASATKPSERGQRRVPSPRCRPELLLFGSSYGPHSPPRCRPECCFSEVQRRIPPDAGPSWCCSRVRLRRRSGLPLGEPHLDVIGDPAASFHRDGVARIVA
jgi:hypothetical protein